MPKVSIDQHNLACIHEAAHAIIFHLMGFEVARAVALMPEARVRRDLGETVYFASESRSPKDTEKLAIGMCAGYVAELIHYYGIERFEGEDVIQLCNRDGGYEAGYAHHLCHFDLGEDAFEDVITKTKRLLQAPNIAMSVFELAALLHRYGTANYFQILTITRHNGLIPIPHKEWP